MSAETHDQIEMLIKIRRDNPDGYHPNLTYRASLLCRPRNFRDLCEFIDELIERAGGERPDPDLSEASEQQTLRMIRAVKFGKNQP